MSESFAPPTGGVASAAPDGWVPVEDRVWGFDRRTIWPGVVALVVWVLFAVVFPAVEGAIEFDNPVEVGDVVDLGAEELTFVPAVGWNLEEGVVVGESGVAGVPLGGGGAEVVTDAVTFTVETSTWEGSADELLDQVLDIGDALGTVLADDVQDRVGVTNVDGVSGVLAPFVGAEQDGFVATFVFERDDGQPSIGVAVTVIADPEAEDALANDVASMLTTITYRPAADEGGEA